MRSQAKSRFKDSKMRIKLPIKLQLIRSFKVLSKIDRRKISLVTFLQMCLSVLDILAVSAMGLLGALTVAGLNASSPENRVSEVLDLLNLTQLSFKEQIFYIGLTSVLLLTSRTILSVFFTRRTIYFLSRRGAQLSSSLISKLLSQPLLKIQEKTTQELLWSLTHGVTVIMLHILATFVTLISDVFLLFIVWTGLFLFSFETAIVMFIVFSSVGLLLYQFMHVRAQKLGISHSKLNIESNEKIVEVLNSYREAIVGNRQLFYAQDISKKRFALAETDAEINFQPYISKYVIESTVVIGALLIGVSQMFSKDASQAASIIAIFLAAATRIAPAVLRVQQGIITLRGALGQALSTLDLIDSLRSTPTLKSSQNQLKINHSGFRAEIQVQGVSLRYPHQEKCAISNITFEIPNGSLVAIIGPSGSGKSTLVDTILGLIVPDEGEILISGLPPLDVFQIWPGAVAYVPQHVNLISGSIRDNISSGYPRSETTDESVLKALSLANLDNVISRLPQGVESQVGEKGVRLSGGEKQRLGIARALFTSPQLLVLDEATSALDAETEEKISESINKLRGSMTVVSIAHRLSTVKSADLIIYLSEGKILALGTLAQVRTQVPDFDNQLSKMSF